MPVARRALAALSCAATLPCTFAIASDIDLRSAYARPAAEWPRAWIDDGVAFVELGALTPPALSPGEATSARLGQRLFFDPRLSASGRVACASCHQPDQGWTVRTATATGAGGAGHRNPPGLQDVARRSHWGWDGAARSLAEQSLRPLTDPGEMANASVEAVWQRLRTVPAYTDLTSAKDMGHALAAFQNTLHHTSRFDRFAQGDRHALNQQELRGLHLFRTQARCANCHFGPTLSDGRFHNLGIAFFGEPSQDLGRYATTRQCDDVGRFRTASLRGVSRTAPYMHHGLFGTLEGVLRLYARGGGDPRNSRAGAADHPLYGCAARVSPHLRPLPLDEADIDALKAFLNAL